MLFLRFRHQIQSTAIKIETLYLDFFSLCDVNCNTKFPGHNHRENRNLKSLELWRSYLVRCFFTDVRRHWRQVGPLLFMQIIATVVVIYGFLPFKPPQNPVSNVDWFYTNVCCHNCSICIEIFIYLFSISCDGLEYYCHRPFCSFLNIKTILFLLHCWSFPPIE
jgi:hypothetical protein